MKRTCNIKTLILLFSFFAIGTFLSCTDYSDVLTESNQQIADSIYSNIKKWEKRSDTSICSYSFFQKINGELYFVCGYTDGETVYYRIKNNSFINNETFVLKRNMIVRFENLTKDIPDYDISASDEQKYEYVRNLVKEMQSYQ